MAWLLGDRFGWRKETVHMCLGEVDKIYDTGKELGIGFSILAVDTRDLMCGTEGVS